METLPGLGPDEGAAEHTYGVAELVDRAAAALQRAFPAEVWVTGEIRALRTQDLPGGLPGSRHVYFTLVEPGTTGTPGAVLPVVLWDSARRAVNRTLVRRGDGPPLVRMGDGVQVRVRGGLDVYGPRAQVQLRMTAIDPAFTLGLLESERDRVLAVLAAEGLVERNRALPAPPVPWRIGLVTAADSAAAADFLHELETSGLHWHVLLAPTRVQGVGAQHEIAAAVAALARRPIDVVALVRGGGARTELAVFDSEEVGRAVATAAVPVVTGIGHEIDTCVADLVAHTAHKTPTACAAALVAGAREAVDRAEQAFAGITSAGSRRVAAAEATVAAAGRHAIDRSRHRLLVAEHQQSHLGRLLTERTARSAAAAGGRLERAAVRLETRGRQRLRDAGRTVDVLTGEVAGRSRRALTAAAVRFEVAEATTTALDPARALARGWTITRDADGRVLRDVDAARRAGTLHTTFVDGVVPSRVDPTSAPDHTPPREDDDG